jgi:Predicted metal-dependent hydrolase with the TIM-barrel fold
MEKVGAERKVDWPSKRVRIEHGEGVAGELVERCKKLGIIVVQNPSHFTVVNEIYTRWGKDTKFSSQRSLITAGVRYALGSDGPVNPFLNIMFAVIHPARPAEAITREEAVRAYTYGSSFAEFSETRKGMLKPGMLADLAVLSQDIFAIPVESLPATESVLTMVGGRVVHDSNVIK